MKDDRYNVIEILENRVDFPAHGATVVILNRNSQFFGMTGKYLYRFKAKYPICTISGKKIIKACMINVKTEDSNINHVACLPHNLAIDLDAHGIPLSVQIDKFLSGSGTHILYHLEKEEFVFPMKTGDHLKVRVYSPIRHKVYDALVPEFKIYSRFSTKIELVME